jgi:midasin (ATPase involved in ribosome maturation)
MAAIAKLEYGVKRSGLNEQVSHARTFVQAIWSYPELQAAMAKRVEELEQTLRRGGSSRFEWVDSVLVRSIVQGEWALFENANLCNPSILDRLNPLLEEGNTNLCINEQGLTAEGDKLRDIKAHPSFRSIFVISQHSLVDQGKDVSRALRNRCLQISINYPTSQIEESNCSTAQKVIDPQLSQMQQDLSIVQKHSDVKSVPQTLDEVVPYTGLGKRN